MKGTSVVDTPQIKDRTRTSPGLRLIVGLGRCAFALVGAVALASCIPIQYSTTPQGHLNSIGLPGLPVWQSQSLAQQKKEAAQGDLAASPGAVMDPRADALPAVQSDEAWLTELNRWRTEAGVQPVGENAALSGAAQDHACYLVKNGPQDPAEFIQYQHRLGASAHSEDPDNQYFSMDGNQAAHTGDIAFDRSPQADVNGLVEVAFHRLSILAPWMHVAGYGDCGHWPLRASTLVIRGSAPAGTTKAVLFPPDGSTVRGAMPTAEWPNPLEACPGYTFPVGTPITVQTGAAVKAVLKSYSVTDQSTGQQVEACGFDFQTYPAQWGQRVLLSYGAVVVVPRHPLSSAHTYAVNIATKHDTYSWTFNVGAAPSAQTANAGQPGS